MLGHEGFKVILPVVFAIFIVLVRQRFEVSLARLQVAELLEAHESLAHRRDLEILTELVASLIPSLWVEFTPTELVLLAVVFHTNLHLLLRMLGVFSRPRSVGPSPLAILVGPLAPCAFFPARPVVSLMPAPIARAFRVRASSAPVAFPSP